MNQATNRERLQVSTDGTAGPYIRLQVSQLDEIRRLLDTRKVHYWASERAFSWDGGPEYTVINLGREGNAVAVQAILDSMA